MLTFIVHRVIAMVPMLFVVSVIIFGLVYLMPGDPAYVIAGDTGDPVAIQRIREELGLDRPVVVRYLTWLADVMRGDLGQSFFGGVQVRDAILQRIPVTFVLAIMSLVIAIAIGVTAGVISALWPGRWMDRVAVFWSSLGLAMPNFWVALILILVFALWLGWLPAGGFGRLPDDPLGWLRTLFLPAVALGTSAAASLARQTRNALIDVLDRPFILAVRAKGMSPRNVIGKHAMKNAAIPVLTVLGLQLAGLLGGAIIVEQIFALPGLGALTIRAVSQTDIPIIQGVVLTASLFVIVVNLLVDIAYAWVNPKVRPA